MRVEYTNRSICRFAGRRGRVISAHPEVLDPSPSDHYSYLCRKLVKLDSYSHRGYVVNLSYHCQCRGWEEGIRVVGDSVLLLYLVETSHIDYKRRLRKLPVEVKCIYCKYSGKIEELWCNNARHTRCFIEGSILNAQLIARSHFSSKCNTATRCARWILIN